MLKKFEREYWQVVYGDEKTMDGVFNAGMHADYLHNLFALDAVQIDSVVDFGFGLGHLFNAALQRFKPYRAVGIEPSDYAFQRGQKQIRAPQKTRLKLLAMDINSWCAKPRKPQRFDLGICTSVFQYLSDAEIDAALPVLAERVKYLYFTVPTDIEAKRMEKDFAFTDPYARHRSRNWYRHRIKPWFTLVSNRLLESRQHFDEQNSAFSELLYRD